MTLAVYLKVKFRAFGITFGTVTQAWSFPIITAPLQQSGQILDYNDHGINLKLSLG